MLEDADTALLRAWRLSDGDHTDDVAAEFETLLPTLIEAGYAEADPHTWRFTPKGVAQAEALAPDARG